MLSAVFDTYTSTKPAVLSGTPKNRFIQSRTREGGLWTVPRLPAAWTPWGQAAVAGCWRSSCPQGAHTASDSSPPSPIRDAPTHEAGDDLPAVAWTARSPWGSEAAGAGEAGSDLPTPPTAPTTTKAPRADNILRGAGMHQRHDPGSFSRRLCGVREHLWPDVFLNRRATTACWLPRARAGTMPRTLDCGWAPWDGSPSSTRRGCGKPLCC
jgi:hypothetical protein